MRALTVEDSRFVRGYVRGLLEARGFECEEAADGQASLNLLHGAKEFEIALGGAASRSKHLERRSRWRHCYFPPRTTV